jgi:cobalt-zinc-cadmium efflux system membrane fusion protein
MSMSNQRGATGQAASPAPPAEPPAAAPGGTDTPLPDVEITLTEDAVARAGIEVTPVAASGAADTVKIPGVIEADAYRRVVVTPLVGGRITRVTAELGQQVRRGATLAQIYSPGLAEAQMKFLSARAELEAAHQELKRTERLVEIGAASRQELERIRASHTMHDTMVAGARAQLVLLGMTPAALGRLTSASEISATTSVLAPIDGVVTERQANPGLNVDPSMPLFTVVDLSSVWVLGDLYEKDFARVRVGSEATITTTAYPGLALGGRVTYIDPQLNAETRTARVRVEVPNPRLELRLGMYAEMQIASRPRSGAMTVPRDAVQTIGDRQFVYVARAGQRGRYVEREVRLGDVSGSAIEVTSGVSPGDAVVTKGSFFVRAERERLGLRQPGAASGMPHEMAGKEAVDTPRVTITEKGFEPDRVSVPGGGPVRITFIRTTDNTCAKEITVPSLKIRRELPLNQPVNIEIKPQKSAEITFTCGMNMLKGAIMVR